ncbi:MAG: hypothetical protein D6682_05800 [Zetaproteobacteria bacterium]|nr:MAG: hypothetical protein D6682_05800 [Zetaproteobacteria bacterium]
MGRRWDEAVCRLHPDRAGVWWDLLLYLPTVGFLLLWGLKLWYLGGERVYLGYLLLFLGCFFALVGGHRVLRRLLITPDSPVEIDVNRERIRMRLKGGETISLCREVRFFSDYAGKSFALSGIDATGNRRQYVLHHKQFDPDRLEGLLKALERYKA